jgi:hypothetical protein
MWCVVVIKGRPEGGRRRMKRKRKKLSVEMTGENC